MATLQLKRGLQANVGSLTLREGEPAFATDTGNLYIGTADGHTLINSSTATTANKLATARNFSITGDGTAANVAFDGSQNVVLNLILAAQSGLAAGTYTKVTVNNKGIITGATTISTSDVTGLGTAATKNTGTASGQIPVLGTGGKIDAALLPAIAISETSVVESQAAMLALTAQVGDVAVRTDLSKSFILKAEPASTLANWQELLTPDCAVQSVAGKTGTVVLTKSDVGLANVDNTADSAKAVASAAKLTTARTIAISGGATGTATSFNGSANVTIPITALDASKLSGSLPAASIPFETVAANIKPAGTAAAGTLNKIARADHVHPAQTTVSGNAGSATKLATARAIMLAGGATGTATFDGTANVIIPVTSIDASKLDGIIDCGTF